MIGPTLALALLAPQIIPGKTEAVIAKAMPGAKGQDLDLRALALGDGGVRAVRIRKADPRPGRGEATTPGGVLVRAKSAGVKFDFPSGRELLVGSDGRVHLRDRGKTLPFLRGLQIILADGARVRIRRGARRNSLASVEVVVAGKPRRIWSSGRRVVDASHTGAFRGTTLFALGDGGALFTAAVAGPLVGLERVLCPAELRRKLPARRLIVVGDVLARSLLRLPAHAPKRSVQFPQVKEAADIFATLGYLFARSVPRPPGAVGELWFPLADQYRLKVAADPTMTLRIGLYREGSAIPGVEWTVAGRTELHFVRPLGGTQGGPRYFLRGIDLRDDLNAMLPVRQDFAGRKAVAKVVTALGGRSPTPIHVERRR